LPARALPDAPPTPAAQPGGEVRPAAKGEPWPASPVWPMPPYTATPAPDASADKRSCIKGGVGEVVCRWITVAGTCEAPGGNVCPDVPGGECKVCDGSGTMPCSRCDHHAVEDGLGRCKHTSQKCPDCPECHGAARDAEG